MLTGADQHRAPPHSHFIKKKSIIFIIYFFKKGKDRVIRKLPSLSKVLQRSRSSVSRVELRNVTKLENMPVSLRVIISLYTRRRGKNERICEFFEIMINTNEFRSGLIQYISLGIARGNIGLGRRSAVGVVRPKSAALLLLIGTASRLGLGLGDHARDPEHAARHHDLRSCTGLELELVSGYSAVQPPATFHWPTR